MNGEEAPKPWWQTLLEVLAGLWTKQQLGQVSGDREAVSGAATALVDLPTFGALQPQPPDLPESRALEDLDPEFRRRYLALKVDFEDKTGRQLFETCTWRSAARQQELYQIGRRGVAGERTVTQIDGVTKRSRHMLYPAEAVDVCVDSDPGPGKHAVWDRAAYELLGALAAAHGLTWGGNWRIDDYPHLELPAEDRA